MKNRFYKSLPVLCALLVAFSSSAFGQGIPPDLEIIGSSGGLAPWSENYYLQITANGQGTYARYIPGAIGQPPLEEKSFTLTAAEVEKIWLAISSNGFFNLEPQFADSSLIDPTFARLVIRANGVTHEVSTQNISITQFDNIVLAINEVTPAETDLVYDIFWPPLIFPTDVCDQFGAHSLDLRSDLLPDKFKRKTPEGNEPTRSKTQNNAPHPGTVVACHISLQDAVDQGLVKLEAKGGFWADQVSIGVNNNPPVKCNNIQITLNLEFRGPNATPANVSRIKSAIERTWNGQKTSDGRTVKMQVNTRLNQRAAFPPGTPGYHQVELTGKLLISYVSGDPKVNEGTGGGKWATIGNGLDQMYAHEAGHLMGLPDRYDDYRKQPNGTWRREADRKVFTSEELAKILSPPGETIDPTKKWLEKPTTQRISDPQPGHHNDLMADLGGKVQQSDIDALVAQAGLVVDVRPGETLVNKNGNEQNLVITRSSSIFVPTAGAIRLDGLYAACIDLNKDIPSTGQRFDLGPHLDTWSGIESAQALFNLLRFVDENELFCDDDFIAQQSIWRITDNNNIRNDGIQNFLQMAGIDLGNALLDFPRLTNPDSTDTSTTALIPKELFVVQVQPRSTLAASAQNVTLKGKLLTPSLPGIVVGTPTWHLETPEGSVAQITNLSDSTVSFTADVRGFYRANLEVGATVVAEDTTTLAVSSAARVVVPDDRTETFEDGELENGPFKWHTEGATYWFVTDLTSHTGSFSAQSYLAFPGEPTRLQVTLSLPEAGKISFAYRVSSRKGYAFFRFYIDGVEQSVWSGEVDWTPASYDLTAGHHTLTWEYGTEAIFAQGADAAWIDDVFFPRDAIFTSVAQQQEIPREYSLSQNYPNPFNPTTRIEFALPQKSAVRLTIYDLHGRALITLIDEVRPAGNYTVDWNGVDARGNRASSGVYWCRIEAGSFVQTRKLLLVK